MSDIINEILKDTPFMARVSGDCVKCGEYKKRIAELEDGLWLIAEEAEVCGRIDLIVDKCNSLLGDEE